jgi:hypothetical protein
VNHGDLDRPGGHGLSSLTSWHQRSASAALSSSLSLRCLTLAAAILVRPPLSVGPGSWTTPCVLNGARAHDSTMGLRQARCCIGQEVFRAS